MPSPIKFSLGLFEVDLAELVGVIGDLTTVKLDQTAKEALQALVAEARKSFDAVVDVLTPLYALNTPAKVKTDFPTLYANFKNAYLKNANEIRTHCHVVTEQIRRLKGTKVWQAKIPILQNAFKRLEAAEHRWAGSDDALADTMQRFLDGVNNDLAGVLAKLQSGSNPAHLALNELIADSEKELRRIKSLLSQLTISSSQLRTV